MHTADARAAQAANHREFQGRERKARPSAKTVIERRVRAEQIRERAAYVKQRRIVELLRLYRARYGHAVPDNAPGRRAVVVMAHHIGDPDRIRMWIDLHAQWLGPEECDAIIYDVVRFPQKWNAEALGRLLGLRDTERQRLGIRTIRASDVSGAERKRRRRESQRRSQQHLRRAHGVVPREVYEARSASRLKPWEYFGVSRSTWRRRGKPIPEQLRGLMIDEKGSAAKGVTKVCHQYPPSVDLHGADFGQIGNSARHSMAADAVTRAQYLADKAARPKPWEAEGIGRAARYRRHKAGSVAGETGSASPSRGPIAGPAPLRRIEIPPEVIALCRKLQPIFGVLR
jgi:hypothetical protein